MGSERIPLYETTDSRALTGPETLCTPGRARPKVLIDTNAVRYLFERDGFSADDLNRVRDRLQQRASVDDVRIVLTTPIGWLPSHVRDCLRTAAGFAWVLATSHGLGRRSKH